MSDMCLSRSKVMRAREDWLKRTGAMWGGGSSAARVHAEPVTQWERTAEPAVPDGKNGAAAKTALRVGGLR